MDRRKQKRYGFGCASYISVKNPSSQLCRIVDISGGGAAFLYYKNGQDNFHDFSEIDLFIRDDFHYLDAIRFKLVSVSKMPDDSYGFLPQKKRVSVKFNETCRDKLLRLNHIILEHTKEFIQECRIGFERRMISTWNPARISA